MLKFGTSGVRGLANKLSDLEVYKFTEAFLKNVKDNNTPQKVYVGMDYRESSPRIAKAVLFALHDLGVKYDFVGILPTPALALESFSNKSLAIMVTGSHIPANRNGLKFYTDHGEILKKDEELIYQTYFNNEANYEYFDGQGFLKEKYKDSVPDLSLICNSMAMRNYASRYKNFFSELQKRPFKVIVYQHSSSAREVLPEILEAMGCEVIVKGLTNEFTPVDTENLECLDVLSQWIKEIGADMLVSTDGDGDRPFVLDDQGKVLRGDQIGMLVSKYLGADSVVVPISTNSAINEMSEFKKIFFTKIGSPFVIEKMKEESLKEKSKVVVGFEANGGYLISTDITLNGKTLSSLETRDAVLPIAVLVAMCFENNQSLSKLRTALPKKETFSGLLKNFEKIRANKALLFLNESVDQFIDKNKENIIGEVDKINKIDGFRIQFKNGEVIHFRPSGNAPEFRCYTEADCEIRAEQLNKTSLDWIKEVF